MSRGSYISSDADAQCSLVPIGQRAENQHPKIITSCRYRTSSLFMSWELNSISQVLNTKYIETSPKCPTQFKPYQRLSKSKCKHLLVKVLSESKDADLRRWLFAVPDGASDILSKVSYPVRGGRSPAIGVFACPKEQVVFPCLRQSHVLHRWAIHCGKTRVRERDGDIVCALSSKRHMMMRPDIKRLQGTTVNRRTNTSWSNPTHCASHDLWVSRSQPSMDEIKAALKKGERQCLGQKPMQSCSELYQI